MMHKSGASKTPPPPPPPALAIEGAKMSTVMKVAESARVTHG